jgi:hypothetical protein
VEDAAASAVNELDPGDYLTVEAMLDAYEAKFMPAASSALAQTIFEQATQKAAETVLDWHSRLYALWKRAYPSSTDATPLIRRFALGLTVMSTRKEILRRRAATYSDALDIAQTEEAVNRATQSTAMNQAIMPAQTMEEPMDINAVSPATARCFNCGVIGHLRKDCTKPIKPRPQAATNGSGNRRNPARSGGAQNGAPRNRQIRRRFYKKVLNALGNVNDSEIEEVLNDEDNYENEEDENPTSGNQESTSQEQEDF